MASSRALLPLLLALVFGIATGGVLVVLPRTAPALIQVEQWPSDLRTGLLSDRPATQHARIVLVTITDQTLAGYPYREPIDRGLLADLVRYVDGAGAAAIGLDIIIDQPTEPAKDDALAAALRKVRAPVVLAEADERVALNDRQRAFQEEFRRRTGRIAGYVNLAKDGDGIVRNTAGPPADRPGARSFAMQLAREAGVLDAAPDPQRIAWLQPPDNATDTFTTLPAHLLLSTAAAPGTALADRFRQVIGGRVVLIGGVFADKDRHQTPLDVGTGESTAGLLIHAQILAARLDERTFANLTGERLGLTAAAIAALGFYLGFRYQLKRYDLAAMLAAAVVLLAVDVYLFLQWRINFPYAIALLAWAVAVNAGHHLGALLAKLWR
jgi:adenylate cyclase